ncbi:hypothetical protein NJB93_16995 [Brucella intermedia]|uniref:hypothetical protein n=1 Tax=Brucella intermedia TaxID=94625 RepID=UPI00209B8B76|nr:hypothetical protein [Brucella intermedia]MCO7728289.1 hypothetical protein [Brucella intermedia]
MCLNTARITAVLLAFILFFELSGNSYALSRWEEFRASKLAVHQTLSGGISPLGWGEEANKRLLDSIEGTWIKLSNLDLSTMESAEFACQKDGIKFYKIDEYSFGVDNLVERRDGSILVIKSEYIGKGGISYAVRKDYRALNKYMKDSIDLSDDAFPLVNNAKTANQEAIVWLLTPNTLIQVDVNFGFPEIYGRCE